MAHLFDSFMLRGHTVKNRIVLPPMVTPHYTGNDGKITPRSLQHYAERSEEGPGIVVVEATAVQQQGRLAPYQLGLWDDSFIPGLSELARIIRSNGAVALIQLHHAGWVTPETVAPQCVAPSADEKNPRSRALTREEIGTLEADFVAAAVRAEKAGFDGIELHGAHGYLLNQFASSLFNRRTDDFGATIEGRMRLATAVIRGIREGCSKDFIIGYRMGANSPTLEEGVQIAGLLEQAGVDILHVSHGGSLQNLPRPPKEFAYNWIVYSGTVVKAAVNIPVIVVNEIKTAERAALLLEEGKADFVALGRPLLADASWVRHVRQGEPVNSCSSCKPKCRWYESSALCPALLRSARQTAG